MAVVLNENAKKVSVIGGKNPRQLYSHQIEAMKKLNILDKEKSFSTLLVLPTGAGKTRTAATWLLTNCVDKGKKIVWIAHRNLLLEQAADSFESNAYSDDMPNKRPFKYRIVSGQKDKPVNIKEDDDILILSKDSIVRDLPMLDKWVKGQDEIYLVIDEAHHATARTYRKIIDYFQNATIDLKILGLTATPFRTDEREQGLLGKIFKDGDGGMVYKIDLETLIKRGILSTPVCENCITEIPLGEDLGLNAIKSIQSLDRLPEDIEEAIVHNAPRNRIIVDRYLENREKYGKALVFALNIIHAFELEALFTEAGVEAAAIVSGTRSGFLDIDISDEKNNDNIESYRDPDGGIQVLISVNILTEGVDLPLTKTVFLTRPTISTVLMTQMVGRALRGEKAGGTKDAYIVSFIDTWDSRIAWVNPESIFADEREWLPDGSAHKRAVIIQLLSIDKIEEFARMICASVDTSSLESVNFEERIPLGMYMFSFMDKAIGDIRHHQILVYDNSEQKYIHAIKALPDLFDDYAEYEDDDETLTKQSLQLMISQIEDAYFDSDMIPPYNSRDIRYLVEYYAEKGETPKFVPFDEIDRSKVNLIPYAKKIVDEDMRESEKDAFIESLWNDPVICAYYVDKRLFRHQLYIAIEEIKGGKSTGVEAPPVPQRVELEKVELSDLPLHRWPPAEARKIKDAVFASAKREDVYHCANCGKSSPSRAVFHIDHIKPMAKGGKTELDNLQLLCRSCNLRKGDRY
jgi:superfamily II DNA or RNA helicase